MISLISKWKLKNGCPPELLETLKKLSSTVMNAEPDTLMYSVHLPDKSPLNKNNQSLQTPPQVNPSDAIEVVFFEIYKNADAFSKHVNGKAFTQFRTDNLHFFDEDPDSPGWPLTITEFLARESAFIRHEAGCL